MDRVEKSPSNQLIELIRLREAEVAMKGGRRGDITTAVYPNRCINSIMSGGC